MRATAYYSTDLGSWVRMVREIDGEYCHTSGYESREAALGMSEGSAADWVHPCDREVNCVSQDD